jgi:hypothetical protein
MIETIGYAGSLLVAVSLMMSNIKKLRWINLSGAALFVVYGLFIKAYPVFILNSFICAADIYYISIMYKKKEIFSYWEISYDNPYLEKFLSFYSDDIASFFPAVNKSKNSSTTFIFILRNLLPVGLFAYESKSNIVDVKIDYAVPEYRDLKNAKFLYSEETSRLKQKGYEFFRCFSDVPEHKEYLKKIGFKEQSDNKGIFLKSI